MFTTAAHIKTGDHIIGDAGHPAGTLDYIATSVNKTTFENGVVMVTVKMETIQDGIPRQIFYEADEKIVLRGAERIGGTAMTATEISPIHIASVNAATLTVGDKVEQAGGVYRVVSTSEHQETEAGWTPRAFFLTLEGLGEPTAFILAVNSRGYTGMIRWHRPR